MVNEEIRLRFSSSKSCSKFDCVSLLSAKCGFSIQHIQYDCWQEKHSWSRSIQDLAVQQKYATIVFSKSLGNPRPESNMQSAQVHLPGSWKELMTHAQLMDLLHVYVTVCISVMVEVRGWGIALRFNPSPSHRMDQDGGKDHKVHVTGG